MTDQIPLFFDDVYDAMRATVLAIGGYKKVGDAIRPDLGDPEKAGRWLADCCNSDRRQDLSPNQLSMLRRMASDANVHILASFEASDAHYAPPVRIEPEDERAALQRQFVEQSKAMQALFARMERAGLHIA
jgi:hypothetical protein